MDEFCILLANKIHYKSNSFGKGMEVSFMFVL